MQIRAGYRSLLSLIALFVVAASAGCAAQPPATTAPAKAAATAPAAAPAAPTAQAGAPAAAPTAQAPAATAAPAKAQPVKGGTAVIAVDSDPETLNPGLSTGYVVGDVAAKVFNGLVWLDGNFTPQPSLAASWTISPDNLIYTFKLRSGVTWHDGQPFTGADVKYSFEEIVGKFHPRSQALIKRIKSIETPDPLTVVVTLKEAYAPFLLQMSVFEAPILPKHLYDGQGDVLKNPANLKPVGTGPFKFVEWNKGSNIKLVRNDKYFEKDQPYLDGIVFQIIPQGANRSTALETGEVDFVVDFYLPKTDVKRLSANAKLMSKRGQGFPAIDFLMMNTQTKALSTKEARQALAFAIDRQRIVDQAMNGIGRVGSGPFGDGFKWLFNPATDYTKLYPHDVAKAKALLDQAGVTAGTDGSRGKLRLVVDSARAPFASAAQIIRENLKEVGFDVELQPLERAVMIQKVFVDRDYDLTLQSYVSSGDPSIGYHRLYATNTARTQFTNASFYSNAKVDELMAKAAVTPLQKDRTALYGEMQTILAADLPSLVLFDEEGYDFATKKLNGLWGSIDSRDGWGVVWMAK
ncbi:MAG TPA: ABC transporter substrate-binding protein [Anaerolineae bacterium]